MTASDIGLPPYKELSLLARKTTDNPFRHGADYYTRVGSEPKIDKSVFLYEMDFLNINQLQELKKQKNAHKILVEDLNKTHEIITKAFNNYIKIQNNFLKESTIKAKRISKMDSFKSIIPVYGGIDIAAEKLKKILIGKYKPSSTQKTHILALSFDFVDITDEFFHNGLEKLITQYLEKINNVKNIFPEIFNNLTGKRDLIEDNFRKIIDRHDKVYNMHLENMLKAMKIYNKRLTTRGLLKLVTLGLK